MAKGDDYDVGYGKPPKSGQFKPGNSGNPKGRPKAPPKVEDLIAREANRKIAITLAGAKVTLSQAEVMVKALMQKAMKGDIACAKVILLGLQAYPHPPEDGALINEHELSLLKEVLAEAAEPEDPQGAKAP